jgi:NAD(P)H dehydrogenase (quinone)
MILVTGANGHLGSMAIDHLLKKKPDADIAGLVRSEEKGDDLKEKGVQIRIGDYFDTDSLDKAFDGVDLLAFISSGTLEDRMEQHNNVVKIAKKKGIGHIFYTSVVKAEERLSPLTFDHEETQNLIKESAIPYTFCRNTIYLEFFPMFWGDALETGKWVFPGGGNKQNFALRSEMAEALATALTEPGNHKDQVLNFASTESFTFEEFAEAMSEVAGKEISYQDISTDDFIDQLKNAGVPQDQLMMTGVTSRLFENGGTDLTTNDMKNLLGREPKDQLEFVKESVKSKLKK